MEDVILGVEEEREVERVRESEREWEIERQVGVGNNAMGGRC